MWQDKWGDLLLTVAAGGAPAREQCVPPRGEILVIGYRDENFRAYIWLQSIPGRQDAALYGRRDARRYINVLVALSKSLFHTHSPMKPQILIVDDDSLMHMLYRRTLENAGYEIAAARSAEEAIEKLAATRPQLIIMDIILPAMNGLTAIRNFKKSMAGDIPILVITGNVAALEAVKKETAMAGATAFMPKPFSPDQLLKEVTRLAPI
jgi:CheY-like chemotaxis protein